MLIGVVYWRIVSVCVDVCALCMLLCCYGLLMLYVSCCDLRV